MRSSPDRKQRGDQTKMSKVKKMYYICDDCNGSGRINECIDYDYEIYEAVKCVHCNGDGHIPVKLVEDK
jgi:hypothetical protein